LNASLVARSIACPDCDLLQRLPPLPPGGKANCARCGSVLFKQPSGPRELPLALTFTAAIAYILANSSPLMDLSVVGREASTTVAGGAYQMWQQGEQITGALVAVCAVIAPGGYLLFMLTLQLAARRTVVPHWVAAMLRWVHHFEVWSMLEVMMLGILVALIKIAQLAKVEAGVGMYAVGALVVLFPAIMVTFNARELWLRVEWADGEPPLLPPASAAPLPDPRR
jgi:paraquat-inducible protein A